MHTYGDRVHRYLRVRRLIAALVFVLLASPLHVGAVPLAEPGQGRYYPQTGHTLAAQFVPFYDSHGGLPLFGYPLTEARVENGSLVQWTERERLEYHPENAGTEHEVLLGLLGSELTRDLNGPRFTPAQAAAPEHAAGAESAGAAFFPQTGQSVSEPFLSYWQSRGGLAVFGYPISSVYRNRAGREVQWFERARFEHHPDYPAEFRVSLGLVGVEALKLSGVPSYELRVSPDPAPDSAFQLGISQGGESEDPGFFDNVLEAGKALGPGLVRIDNIYNFYNIVQHSGPAPTYRWDELDRVLDNIRAMGKEPMLCLSYMPESMSAAGSSRVMPPRDYSMWANLVAATVRHVNVERGLGVRYWEVWNEPNQWSFWQGSFEDYLRLYEATVRAAIAVDPTVKIGGPAFSSFEPAGMNQFLAFVAQVPGIRADFVSWHAYGRSPGEIAEEISQARVLVSRFPSVHPELIIDEFNVLQGGEGDTSAFGHSDTVEGAINLLASVESMQREHLDRALLFELKDGVGPSEFWGRWGILTNGSRPKPIYYAVQAYQNRPPGMLPVALVKGPADGTVGLMGFGSSERSTLLLWYTGQDRVRIKVALPAGFAGTQYSVALFDEKHNNPRLTDHARLDYLEPTYAGDLLLDASPNSLYILTSMDR